MGVGISVSTEALRDVATGSHGLCATANELQSVSQSMRNVNNNMSSALRSRYTEILQDSMTRICNKLDRHATELQQTGNTVLNIAERYETVEQENVALLTNK